MVTPLRPVPGAPTIPVLPTVQAATTVVHQSPALATLSVSPAVPPTEQRSVYDSARAFAESAPALGSPAVGAVSPLRATIAELFGGPGMPTYQISRRAVSREEAVGHLASLPPNLQEEVLRRIPPYRRGTFLASDVQKICQSLESAGLNFNDSEQVRRLEASLLAEGYYFIIFKDGVALSESSQIDFQSSDKNAYRMDRFSLRSVEIANFSLSRGDAKVEVEYPLLQVRALQETPYTFWSNRDLVMFTEGGWDHLLIPHSGMQILLDRVFGLDFDSRKDDPVRKISIKVGGQDRVYDYDNLRLHQSLAVLAEIALSDRDNSIAFADYMEHPPSDPYYGSASQLLIDLHNDILVPEFGLFPLNRETLDPHAVYESIVGKQDIRQRLISSAQDLMRQHMLAIPDFLGI